MENVATPHSDKKIFLFKKTGEEKEIIGQITSFEVEGSTYKCKLASEYRSDVGEFLRIKSVNQCLYIEEVLISENKVVNNLTTKPYLAYLVDNLDLTFITEK